MSTVSKEDYLSVIFKNLDEKNEVKANVIAEKLSISNAAVTDMLKKLSNEDLVIYEKYKPLKLTEDGFIYAKNMIRRHRIWEMFLHQVVRIPWDKVHEEAEKLEHSSSDFLINKLEEMLNFPEFDPHGDPIPAKDLKLPKQKKSIKLSLMKINQKGKVVRVNDFDHEFLSYISKIGIDLKVKLKVKEIREFDKSMSILIGNKDWNISQTIADNIFVEIDDKKG